MKNKKRGEVIQKRIVSLFEIFLLVSLSFAIAFMFSQQAEVVSAVNPISLQPNLNGGYEVYNNGQDLGPLTGKAPALNGGEDIYANGKFVGTLNAPETPAAPAVDVAPSDSNGNAITAASTAPSAWGLLKGGSKTLTLANGNSISTIAGYDANMQAVTYVGPGTYVYGSGYTDAAKLAEQGVYGADGKAIMVNGKQLTAADYSYAQKSSAPTSWIGKLYTGNWGATNPSMQWLGSLGAGLAWAGTAYLAVTLIGGLLGLQKGTQQALQNAVLAGGFTAGTLQALGTNHLLGLTSKSFLGSTGGALLVGGAIAIAVFIATYTSTRTEMVTFTCQPYEPILGGAKCEQCNNDPFRPCSEYRCKSLGQACQLLNAGTGNEKCAWVNPKDVTSPTIEPWKDALSPTGLKYSPDNTIRPPNRGVKIINPNDPQGCLQAFTKLNLGVALNEPGQCKVDYTRSNATGNPGFDAMQFYLDNNYYDYNHTLQMLVPNFNANDTNSSPVLTNGDTMNLFVKCRDANGNVNEDDFVFDFCVNKGPDTTPPIVEGTSINSGGFVGYNADNVPIEVYTNEPAQCKWSRIDTDFSDMQNNMSCATSQSQINSQLTFTCSGNLTGVKNQEDNNFFFRCKDYPDSIGGGNNEMQQSYPLVLKGSQPLTILGISPNGTIRGNTDVVPVTIQVKSGAGAEEGKAICYYSPTGLDNSYIQMFQTNDYVSTQTLDLTGSPEGTNYTYYARCIDAGGNAADTSTIFSLIVDKNQPIVTRAYKEIPDALKIVTNKDADCGYSLSSCDFSFNDSQKMLHPGNIGNINAAEWKSNAVYYIKCVDSYGNGPDPSVCSIVVNAVELSKTAQTQ